MEVLDRLIGLFAVFKLDIILSEWLRFTLFNFRLGRFFDCLYFLYSCFHFVILFSRYLGCRLGLRVLNLFRHRFIFRLFTLVVRSIGIVQSYAFLLDFVRNGLVFLCRTCLDLSLLSYWLFCCFMLDRFSTLNGFRIWFPYWLFFRGWSGRRDYWFFVCYFFSRPWTL